MKKHNKRWEMNKIIMISFLLFFTAHSMEDNLIDSVSDSFKETLRYLYQQNCLYTNAPNNDNGALDEKRVVNTFWTNKRNVKQKDKDRALKTIHTLHFDDNVYFLKRYLIAGGLYIGADPNIKIKQQHSILFEAALHQDIHLCELLLKKKTDPNFPLFPSPFLQENIPPLFLVKNKKLASLFLQHWAEPRFKSSNKNSLLHYIVYNDDYDIELIPLYLKEGLSPFEVNECGNTCLHECARKILNPSLSDASFRRTLKVMKIILASVPSDAKKELIATRNKNGLTVKEMLRYSTSGKELFDN